MVALGWHVFEPGFLTPKCYATKFPDPTKIFSVDCSPQRSYLWCLMWWRVFIPTWRFFDQVDAPPQLWVKSIRQWEAVPARLRGTWFTLFHNPQGNLVHAQNNLYTRLLFEAQQNAPVDKLVSYQLVEQIARQYAILYQSAKPGDRFQFKLVSENSDALLSPPLRVKR